MDQISICPWSKTILVIPCDVDQYYHVMEFDITGSQVSILPVELFNLNLRKLNLHNNVICTLPKEIKNLTNLERLRIGNNKLSKLPKELFSLKNCTHLLLNGNIYMDTYGSRKERFEELKRNRFID